MVEANINILDGVIIAIMAISCLVAFIRGFVRELLSLGAWLAAFAITLYLYPYVANMLKGHMKHEMAAVGIAALGTYLVVLMLLSLLNSILIKYVKSGADVGMLDNFLGLLFGALRGAFIVSLGFFLLTYVMDKDQYPEWVATARTKPYAEAGARMLARLAPHYLEEMSSFAKEKGEKAREEMRQSDGADKPESTGYNAQMRENLERMLNNGTEGNPTNATEKVEYQ